MESARRGLPMRIDGDGEQTRDFIHISDVVNANVFCMQSLRFCGGEIRNGGTGTSVSLNNIKDDGIFYFPTDHFGNSQRSDEEADIIYDYYSKIFKKKFEDEKGIGNITNKDIMEVAQFNVQANAIKKKI